MEPDPEVGEEDDEDAIRARAPQDLDASDDRIHLPGPGGDADDVLHRGDGPPTEVIVPDPALCEALHREDGPPTEVTLPDPALGEAPHRKDVSPTEDMLPPRDADEPEPITDPAWSLNLTKWSKHVSSEVAKQVVTTIMLAPDVEGYTTRGVTVTSVPVGKVAQFITSRHHVPSEAEWRRTAVQLREEDKW